MVFDEVHFGGFAQKYLTGQFFLDLHPPLARLLVTLSAWLGGFDGKFTFYGIGADYIRPGVPYILMRAFTATLGALVVPMAFVTLRGIGVSFDTASALSTMIIFENGLVTQSRLILLDSYLVFFTVLTALFWVLFKHMAPAPFSSGWKAALLGLGASMALAASCKWVGLFLVGGVGIHTVAELWHMLGDTRIPLKRIGRHFSSRSVGLIALPLALYTLTFYPHFALQRNFNTGATGMSLEYQQTLAGGQTPPCPRDLHFGAFVRIRQWRPTGPFIHSHAHVYPAGSKQQQVTGYHHRDGNNVWMVRRPFIVNATYIDPTIVDEHAELVPLRHGDMIRLEHIGTGRFLHSHVVEPPMASKEHHQEVSCYGHNPSRFSDLNDNWYIQLTDAKGNPLQVAEDQERPIVTAMTRFRLVHSLTACSLTTAGKSLPDWAYKQNEITCSREARKTLALWAVEHNDHPLLRNKEDLPTVSYKPLGFLGKFLELNKRMWQTNAGLSADHPFASRPGSWPLLTRGLGFWNGNHIPDTEKLQKLKEDAKNGVLQQKVKQIQPKKLVEVGEDGEIQETAEDQQELDAAPMTAEQAIEAALTEQDRLEHAQLAQDSAKFRGCQIYLIGNPPLWWASTGALVLFALTLFVYRFAVRRSLTGLQAFIESTPLGSSLTIHKPGGFFFLQWLFHFLPFFGMQRQLFLHHYLPALYFALMLLGLCIDTALCRVRTPIVRHAILFAMTAVVVITFLRFSPLSYGFAMNKSQCERLKWLPRWDFDCSSLPEPIGNVITTPAAEL